MAEVTSITNVTQIAIPGLVCYTCVASDGETLTIPNFSSIGSVQITYAADPSTGNPWGYTVSGNVITLQCTSASDVTISVWVQGRQ